MLLYHMVRIPTRTTWYKIVATAVAQWLKTPGIHCYVADSIPAVTPRYSTNKIRNALRSTNKN